MNSAYRCTRCGNVLPISNRTLHDLHCQGSNMQQQFSNNNQIMRNNFRNNNYNNMNQMNNNIQSINTNTTPNQDGTITEIRTETYQNGSQRIIRTLYDRNHNKISEQEQYINQNNNFNINMIMNNNIQTTVDQFGNVTETRSEQLPNGQIRKISITRDRNGNTISQSMNTSSFGNNMNINMGNMGMNYMMNGMNGMMNGMNAMMNSFGMMNGMNGMNGMNMNIGMNMNNMNNMNNMMNFNNLMSNMNQMFNNIFNNNNMGMNFANMNNVNDNHGVEPQLLNNLQTTKLQDISKLEDDKKNCIICMEDFKVGDEVIYLPCLHVFHKDCILEWLGSHDDCPICKFKINYENLGQNN